MGSKTPCEYFRKKRKQRQSSHEPAGQASQKNHTHTRLSKPPPQQALQQRPRNRLQKRTPAPSRLILPTRYILEYEAYPYQTTPSTFLGVYSSVNAVTARAFAHGAYTFSREGLVDGSEYLSATGRLKIHSQAVQQSGLEATMPNERRGPDTEYVRPDIPHPDSPAMLIEESNKTESQERVFLAIEQTPTSAFCIGIFANRRLAWGACLKNRAASALSERLRDETQTLNVYGMPKVQARLDGGQCLWFVAAHDVDR